MIFDIPKAVLDRMTKDEARAIIAEQQAALTGFEDWNDDRAEANSPPIPWQDVPPPKSLDEYNWRVKSRR